jgi:hypothetical protein
MTRTRILSLAVVTAVGRHSAHSFNRSRLGGGCYSDTDLTRVERPCVGS